MKRLNEETRKIVYKETINRLAELGFEQLSEDMFKYVYESVRLYIYLPMVLAFSDKMHGAIIEEFSMDIDIYERNIGPGNDLLIPLSQQTTMKRIKLSADTLDELLDKFMEFANEEKKD